MIIWLFGKPGAGKTALGIRLATGLGKQYIDGDDLYNDDDRKAIKDGIITEEASDAFLARLLGHIESVIQAKDTIVVSQSLFRESQRKKVKEKFGKRVLVVYLDVPRDTVLKRIRARSQANHGTEADEVFYGEQQFVREEHFFEEPVTFDLKVNNSGSIVDGLRNITKAVED